jgi:hypothetical protein
MVEIAVLRAKNGNAGEIEGKENPFPWGIVQSSTDVGTSMPPGITPRNSEMQCRAIFAACKLQKEGRRLARNHDPAVGIPAEFQEQKAIVDASRRSFTDRRESGRLVGTMINCAAIAADKKAEIAEFSPSEPTIGRITFGFSETKGVIIADYMAKGIQGRSVPVN